MVQRIIANFQAVGVFPIVLVTGFRGQELEKHISKTGVICIRNEKYGATQMFDSAKIGFSYILDKCDRTFFTPVDIPLVAMSTITRLMASQASVAKPLCGGEEGHPILLSCRILPALIGSGGEGGLKRRIDECGGDVQLVEVGDEGILRDADTPSDYGRLLAMHNEQLLRPSIEISLMRENKLFDPKGAMLLRMIEYTGTVKGACEKIQVSYSMAWGILSTLEENLGFALIDRKHGGELGGRSQLTDEGRDLLDRYERYSERVRLYADENFGEFFGARR